LNNELTAGPRQINDVNNIIVVSDIHGGCKLAVCPPEGIDLDDGGKYMPSGFQRKLYGMWRHFWDEWVPFAVRGERYCIVVNGDAVEGTHHRATTPISHNMGDQCKVTKALLAPEVEKAKGGFYMVRGTEAHVGISAVTEEGMAQALGAIPNDEGQYCRWDLWKQIGDGKLVNFLHHVGTTSSTAYESTAVYKELTEMYVEASRWRQQPPDIIVRSHRHRNIQITIPVGTVDGQTSEASAIVTPAWQGKTPFAWKIPGARISTPQFGGVSIRFSDDGVLYATSKVWTVERTRTE
jgi:hypothetical protein